MQKVITEPGQLGGHLMPNDGEVLILSQYR
jgi:hypothetical protein